MDPVSNPYSPGAGSRPPALVGRDDELAQFDVAVQRLALGRPARSVMLTGLRGVGKTVLLREFGMIARGYGWDHQHLEATEDIDVPEAVATLTRKSVLRLSRVQRLTDQARRAAGVVRSFQLRWNIPVAGSLDLGLDPVPGFADSGSLEDDLADLFVELGLVARDHEVGVLFTLDEVQHLSREHLAALIVGLHRVSQEELPVMVVGAGLPSLPALAGEAKSYAERLFMFARVDSLDDLDARDALATPAAREGVNWQTDALDLVVEQSRGYPYFIQEFGKESWNIAPGPDSISRRDVEQALPIVTEELDSGFFSVRFDRTTPAEREYLAAMASLGEGPVSSGEVARAMGNRTTQQVGPTRDSLIKRGLCYSPRYGEIAFTVPMFDQYVNRRLRSPLPGETGA